MVRTEFPWVTLVESGGNDGFARAANIGLRRATSDAILLLNPDTEVSPTALAECRSALEAHPEVGMVGCKLVRLDGSLDHACKRGFPTPRSSLTYFARLGRGGKSTSSGGYTADHLDENEVGYVDAVNGAFMLLRRSAVDTVGLLDEQYWMYGEDLDWCYRFWARGWKVLYWPCVTVLHVKGGVTGQRRSLRTNAAFHHSMWIFYRKHYAPHSNPGLNALVWLGIWLKFGVSVAGSASARALAVPRNL
jgi:GT2 family glycosyltransferase